MPDAGKRVSVGPGVAAALLSALALAAAPVRAEEARAELNVTATVSVSCLASTASPASAPGRGAVPATSSCSDGGSAEIAVDRQEAAPERLARPRSAAAEPAAGPAAPLTVITITY